MSQHSPHDAAPEALENPDLTPEKSRAETTPLRSTPHNRKVGFLRFLPLVPALLVLLAFLAGPIIYSVYLAFTNRALRGEGSSNTGFVGFANFAEAFSSPGFWNAVWLTLVFTFISAVIGWRIAVSESASPRIQ